MTENWDVAAVVGTLINIMFAFSSRKNSKKLAISVLATAIALWAFPLRAGPPAESAASRSISVGLPMRGSLERGEVLPKKGSGYRMIEKTRQRKARFGVFELVMLIKDAAHKVQRKHRGSVLQVADLSTRKGGEIDHHGSHQNGRDVDFVFYMVDAKGKPVVVDEFVPFDSNGFSVDPPMKYRFDVERNWALVEALLRSSKATVQWIFVADHLRKLLLDHAEKIGAPASVRRKAKQVLRQPGKKAHWDHFHVRIYCPSSDKPRCEDVGPRWAWTR